MKLKFLTSNMHKYNEISAFLGQLGIECQWVKMKYEEIQGESTEEISRDSAVKLSRQMGDKFFLEDTGLYINSLKGFPGPYSSYISKTIGNEGILDLLKNKERSAYFLTVISYFDGTNVLTFQGKLDGRIADKIPEKALIIGGGDGGAAGELLKLGLKSIINVEIDGQVVEVCRKHFPKLTASFNDPKVKLIVDDGIKYARNTKEKFDIIIVDSTDPVGPAEDLFNEEFYSNVSRILNDGGVVVTQSGSPFYQPRAIELANKGMRKSFSHVASYVAFIPAIFHKLHFFPQRSSKYLLIWDEHHRKLERLGIYHFFIRKRSFPVLCV